jgi:hypothetical protein
MLSAITLTFALQSNNVISDYVKLLFYSIAKNFKLILL